MATAGAPAVINAESYDGEVSELFSVDGSGLLAAKDLDPKLRKV